MPELEQVPCRVRDVLLDADNRSDHVFFPDNCIISVVAVYVNGDIIEMATIGREGFTGFQATFGVKMSAVRFLVQGSRKHNKTVARRVYARHGFDAFIPQTHVRVRSGPSSAGPGFRRVQWQTRP
jgi:hypothetical protein